MDAVPGDMYADAQQTERRKAHRHYRAGRAELAQDFLGVAIAKIDGAATIRMPSACASATMNDARTLFA
jgi:hypothetical protein